jgi:hypothetical protein
MLRRTCWGIAVSVGVLACQTLRPRSDLSPEQLALISADSEVFAAVVQPQLEAGARVYLYSRDSVRFDARPYGDSQEFRPSAGGGHEYDPGKLFDRPDWAMMILLTENRRKILKLHGVREGGAFSYPDCSGTLAPPPPPSTPGSPQPKVDPSGRRPGCPAAAEIYQTVGIPVRGFPEPLRKLNGSEGKPVDATGDVWTVIVDEHYAGPYGQNWFQRAWVLRRNPATGKLAVAGNIILAFLE